MSATCDRFDVKVIEQIERGEPLDGHFRECASCRETAEAYDQIRETLSRVQPEGAPAANWEAQVWAGIRRRETKRLLGRFVPAFALSAAAVVAFIALPGGTTAPRLEVDVRPQGGEVVRNTSSRPGDLLSVRGSTGGKPVAELRVYRDGTLVFHCADQSPCVRKDEVISAQFPLTSLGRYETVLLVSEVPLGAPETGMNADLEAALAGGAKVVTSGAVDVF